MKKPLLALALLGALLASPSLTVHAQSHLSAREALGLVSSQFGPQATAWIAEMRAQGGVPQPGDWQILSYDERAPRLLYRFWAGGGRAGDGGADDLRYPDDVPVGYFNASQIGVDSVAAFTIAEGEARKARVAFDSCNYLLRLREFSTEPVWRLELFDLSRQIAGKIYISAGNGEVLRTVWIHRDQRSRPDGRPLIVDSAAPGGRLAPTGLSSNALPPAGGTIIPPIPGRVPGQVPGTMNGIHLVPLPPAPGVAVAGPGAVAPGAVAPPYSTTPPDRPAMTAPSSSGIPAPPPLNPAVPAAPVAPAPIPAPPAPVASTPAPAPAPAPAPNPTKPPIKPSASGGGDSNRIPPPPIP